MSKKTKTVLDQSLYPQLSDEELAEKHGFDHCYSFRKKPSKRKPKSCKDGIRR